MVVFLYKTTLPKTKMTVNTPNHQYYNGIPVTGPREDRTTDDLARLHGYADLGDMVSSLPEKAKVLDAGAGLSTLGHEVTTARPDVDWTNLDASYAKSSPIRTQAEQDAPPNLHIVQGDVRSLVRRHVLGKGFAPDTFDEVVSHFLVPHLVDRPGDAERAAAQLFRVAKVGGRLSIGPVFDVYDLNSLVTADDVVPTVRLIKPEGGTGEAFARDVAMKVLPPIFRPK